MKIVVIGKSGQVGAALVECSSNDNTVFAYSRNELDVTDFVSIEKILIETKPDVLINASAFHVVSECESSPEQAFLINAIALKEIAELCKKSATRFVTYSTDYVFDGTKGVPYTEDDRPNPLQMYGISKLAGENISFQYNNDALVIRTCGVYGGVLGSRAKRGNFILNILKEAKNKRRLEVSSEQIVSPTYAADLAKATLKLVNTNPTGGIYHLVNSGYCSWAEFATEALRLTAISIKVVPVNRRGMSKDLRRPLFSALKNTNAAKIGVALPTWKDALSRYISFLT